MSLQLPSIILMKHLQYIIILSLVGIPYLMMAQIQTDSTAKSYTLDECVVYALKNKPSVQQAYIDEAIGEREIKANLSAWLPQVSAQYNASHNFKLQTAAFGDQLISIGRRNNSNILLEAEQILYSRDVM